MKKLKPYIYTSLIVTLILAVTFFIKGIYPFGNISLIWGDMHDQITAFYYHLYDSIKGNSSVFVDFTTSGGINFFGILAYYILSPFSLIILLFPRTEIYLVVTLIVSFKILVCSLTCLYFTRTYFKNMPSILHILLAIIYATSSYGLIMYQITPWIDAMYMTPLIMIGLKKLLDLENPTYYVVTITITMILSFYVSFMIIAFIFLASLIYLYVYKEKEKRKKAIVSLGIFTILSILISLVIVIPSYDQIMMSSRLQVNIKTLLNSKTGPIIDKISMLTFGGIIYTGILLLIKDYKKNKKFLTCYIPTLLIVLIPLIVEPINKIWHFGTYASFPYRYGFITMFLLILGAAYSFNKFEEIKFKDIKYKEIISCLITGFTAIFITFITQRYYMSFQKAIYRLSLSFNKHLIIILLITTFITIVACIAIIILNKKLTKFPLVLIFIISIVHIYNNASIYLGVDYAEKQLNSDYKLLGEISKDYKENDYYRVKSKLKSMVTNNGMVMKYHNIDHFTSLTEKTNLEAIKKLGFGTQWVKIYSRGATMFMDSIFANKYLLTNEEVDSKYYDNVKQYENIYLYKTNNKLSYGFLINDNDTIFDKNNSFEISNSLYKNILSTTEELFEIDNHFELKNIKATKMEDELTNYEIIDKDYFAYFEKEINVTGKKNLYLEIPHSLRNDQNFRLNNAVNIYINDKLYKEDAFLEPDNGVLDLGIYEDETVSVKVEIIKDILVRNVYLGSMDMTKFEDFLNKYYIDTNIDFNKNKVSLKVNVNEDNKILFVPLAYSDNYTAKVNGKKVETVKMYENFIGIKVNKGENDITLTYIPNTFTKTLVVSIVSLIVTIILLVTKFYNRISDNTIIQNIAFYLYIFGYIAAILLVYVLLMICFLLSYFTVIRI